MDSNRSSRGPRHPSSAPVDSSRPPRVWYENGLNFTCTRCGKCCREREVPTFVFLEDDDIPPLCEALRLDRGGFLKEYCVKSEDGPILRNGPEACVFWEGEQGCRVYSARPVQCRTWPFWPSNLRRRNWLAAARFCPGCNRGRLYNRAEIEFACWLMLGGRGDGSLWPGEVPLPRG
jgi:Fe-S-cluster containining protein